MMPINDAGVALLEEFESFVGHAYPDPYSPLGKALRRAGTWQKYLRAAFPLAPSMRALSGAPWTIGFGFTDDVHEGDTMTRQQGLVRLAGELNEYVEAVRQACTTVVNANQLAAMVCMAWNVGIGGFKRSTVLKAHNRGDLQSASRAFGLWNRAGGEESAGLTRRRAAEAALYLKPVLSDSTLVRAVHEPLPQVVEPESKMARSPIVLASGASTAIAAMTTVVETSTQVRQIRDNLGLGDLGSAVAPYAVGAMVLFGGYVIWQRLKQRSGGWA